jgi:hypothetical protein
MVVGARSAGVLFPGRGENVGETKHPHSGQADAQAPR